MGFWFYCRLFLGKKIKHGSFLGSLLKISIIISIDSLRYLFIAIDIFLGNPITVSYFSSSKTGMEQGLGFIVMRFKTSQIEISLLQVFFYYTHDLMRAPFRERSPWAAWS